MQGEISDLRRRIFETTPGWLASGEAVLLRRYALATSGPFAELGSYCGKSAIWLGDAAEAVGTVLFSIDNHRGVPNMPGPDDTFARLVDTIDRAKLRRHVIPILGDTSAVAEWWRTPLSMLFIDGDHGPQVIEDLDRWQGWVTDVLAFHDSSLPDVARAIDLADSRYGWRVVEVADLTTFLRRK